MNMDALQLELTKFPMRFSLPVFFGKIENTPTTQTVNNGTAALIQLGNKKLAITCHHVLEAYRNKKDDDLIFQIGNHKVDPEDILISENKELDLAVMDISSIDASQLSIHTEIGAQVFSPATWPPSPVNSGDYISFGGFPGVYRESESNNELSFGSYSSGGCEVHSVTDEQITCRIELDKKDIIINNEASTSNLGGISGCPVFILRELNFEYIGNVYQYSEALDLLLIRKANYIDTNGVINA